MNIQLLIRSLFVIIICIIPLSGNGAVKSEKLKYSFTLVVLPDTQLYYEIRAHPRLHLFDLQTQWISDYLVEMNIKFVIHLGDIIQTGTDKEWNDSVYSMSNLDGLVPYALSVGNHDMTFKLPGYVRDNKKFNQYYSVERYSELPSFGGVFEPGKLENSYHYFSGGGFDYLVIGLEYLPRDKTLSWANMVVGKHPNHKVIVFTHSYIHHDNDYAGPDSDPSIQRKLNKEPFR